MPRQVRIGDEGLVVGPAENKGKDGTKLAVNFGKGKGIVNLKPDIQIERADVQTRKEGERGQQDNEDGVAVRKVQRKGVDGVGMEARERVKGKRASEKEHEKPQKRAKMETKGDTSATRDDEEHGSEGGGVYEDVRESDDEAEAGGDQEKKKCFCPGCLKGKECKNQKKNKKKVGVDAEEGGGGGGGGGAHKTVEARKVKAGGIQKIKFAPGKECFVCKKMGHIGRDCPQVLCPDKLQFSLRRRQ